MPPDSSEIKIKSTVGNCVTLKMFLQNKGWKKEKETGGKKEWREGGRKSVSQS